MLDDRFRNLREGESKLKSNREYLKDASNAFIGFYIWFIMSRLRLYTKLGIPTDWIFGVSKMG